MCAKRVIQFCSRFARRPISLAEHQPKFLGTDPRDDKGYWNPIESYIHARSEAEFRHGMYPECAH